MITSLIVGFVMYYIFGKKKTLKKQEVKVPVCEKNKSEDAL